MLPEYIRLRHGDARGRWRGKQQTVRGSLDHPTLLTNPLVAIQILIHRGLDCAVGQELGVKGVSQAGSDLDSELPGVLVRPSLLLKLLEDVDDGLGKQRLCPLTRHVPVHGGSPSPFLQHPEVPVELIALERRAMAVSNS